MAWQRSLLRTPECLRRQGLGSAAVKLFFLVRRNVRFGSEADICSAKRHVRFTPKSGHVRCASSCLLCASDVTPFADYHPLTCASCPRHSECLRSPTAASGIAKSGHRQPYWITSSARAIKAGGAVRPSALAVLRLIASSNFVGSSTGRSPGASPFRMRPT